MEIQMKPLPLRRFAACLSTSSIVLAATTFVATTVATTASAEPLPLTTSASHTTELAAVDVSASRTAASDAILPQGSVVIGRKQLNHMPATNLTQALQSIGGVHISNTYGGGAGSYGKVDIGGFGVTSGQNTLILLNGRRLNTIDSSSVNLGAIPLSAIERIEVVPASGAVLYGSGAVGGVVNVITRQHYGNHGRIEADYGDNNTRGGNVQGSFSKGPVDGLLSLGRLGSDNYRDNNASWQSHAFSDLRYVNENASFYLTALANKEKIGLPGTLSEPTLSAHPQRAQIGSAHDWGRDKTVRVMPGASYRFNKYLTLHLDSGFRVRKQESFYAAFMTSPGQTIDRTLSISPRFSGQFDAGLTNRWTAGVDYFQTHYSIDRGASQHFERHTRALYALDSIALTDSTWLTLGARHSWVKTTKKDHPNFLPHDKSDTGMWSVGLRQALNDHFSLFAKAERNARFATLDDYGLVATPLKTQTGRVFSAGAKWHQGGQYSTLTLWRGNYHNEIMYDPSAVVPGSNFAGANVNLDPTKRQGASLNSYWKLDKNLWLAVTGTYQEAHFDDGKYAGHNVPLVPRVSGYARLDWQALKQVSVSLSERYQGKQYMDNDQANSFGKRIGSYHWMNLAASWRPTGKQGFYMTLALYNATNREGAYDYAGTATYLGPNAYTAYPLPGRYWLLKTGVNF